MQTTSVQLKRHVPLIRPDLPTLEEIESPIREILQNGKITNFARYVCEFEAKTAEYLYAETVAVSSGTAGLVFSLCASGVRPGTKVLLPSFTFMATAQAVLLAGAIPVFVEIEDDLNMSPADLAEVLHRESDVSAVIAVHMYGLPAATADLQAVVDEASRRLGRHIPLLFDAAHAFGAAVGERRIGSFGDAEIFSLSVTKMLVAVEGGLVSTRRPEIADKIRRMRNYGIQSDYDAHYRGMNGKMSEFHAIVGLANLRHLHDFVEQRQVKAARYRELIEEQSPFRVMPWPAGVTPTFKDFSISMPSSERSNLRKCVVDFLAERGIETRAYFHPPVHEQRYFRPYADRSLPRTEFWSKRVLTLPFNTGIAESEMSYVAEQLAEAGRRYL